VFPRIGMAEITARRGALERKPSGICSEMAKMLSTTPHRMSTVKMVGFDNDNSILVTGIALLCG
jgi:hypothetical protein